MDNPLVSIIMPCHNGEKYLSKSIDSVLSQSFTNWELIVVDDFSSDNSVSIIQDFAQQDSRIKLYHNDKATGRPATPRNYGIKRASGDYIAFLDCDDLWAETHLSKMLMVFTGNNVVAAFSWYCRIDENGCVHGLVKTPHTLSYRHLFYDNFIGNLTGMYDVRQRGKVYQRECGHEDYIMWLEVLKGGGIAKSTDSIEAYYRVSNNSVSSNKFKAMAWRWNILRKDIGLSVFPSIYYIFASFFFIGLKKSRFSYMLPWLIKA